MQDDINLVSLVLMAKPEKLDTVTEQIHQVTGAEIHVCNADGKMVVTAEADNPRTLMDRIESLQNIEGLVASNLVYHQVA